MKKYFYYLSLMLRMMMGIIMLNACGGDDHNDGIANNDNDIDLESVFFVGNWEMTVPDYGFPWYVTLTDDQKATFVYDDEIQRGQWNYDSSSRTLNTTAGNWTFTNVTKGDGQWTAHSADGYDIVAKRTADSDVATNHLVVFTNYSLERNTFRTITDIWNGYNRVGRITYYSFNGEGTGIVAQYSSEKSLSESKTNDVPFTLRYKSDIEWKLIDSNRMYYQIFIKQSDETYYAHMFSYSGNGTESGTLLYFGDDYIEMTGKYSGSAVETGVSMPTVESITYNGSAYNNGSGTDDDGDPTSPVWGKITGTISAIGPGVYYSNEATFADGKTTTVDYVYYPETGNYYVYGGTFCSDPTANSGKGLRYDAKKGYNSIAIKYGFYYDYTMKIKYDWELRLIVTLP